MQIYIFDKYRDIIIILVKEWLERNSIIFRVFYNALYANFLSNKWISFKYQLIIIELYCLLVIQ